jgi:poly(3-hydroxybutyrate) depolymerase
MRSQDTWQLALTLLACACSGADPDGRKASEDPTRLVPIEAPVPDDCITDVSAGDHTFSCSGLTFLVKVDEQCTERACGLIFDVHGGTMSGAQMRDNTQLHELGAAQGYLVVHPSATPGPLGAPGISRPIHPRSPTSCFA